MKTIKWILINVLYIMVCVLIMIYIDDKIDVFIIWNIGYIMGLIGSLIAAFSK